MVDDVGRAVRWVWAQFAPSSTDNVSQGGGISRSDFLVKSSIVVSAVPALTMGYGIISGAHDYRIRSKTVYLKNLPASFDGIRLAQISDIHSGSFFNKTAVKGGIDMLLAEKPDLVFFTGDLVNDRADEVKDYQDVFSKVKAPLGVYSTLGNHDYGDYANWQSADAKRKNLQNLIQVHKQMGWDLLMNDNRFLQQGSDRIAIMGIENWGTGGFAKYGRLDQAYKGTQDAPVKLLLSHDPSHWDAQVRQEYKDIDIMFAGHTHGMQFGIEIGDFKWSPVQYRYKQWAGLYQQAEQYLYVNRGYGYLVFPGRIGILPEITIMELKKA
jgi:predicted MPP superfamily phosphohydrolase